MGEPWPELVREHGPLVWSTSYRLLRCRADAADCFQATFLAALDVARREPVRSWPGLLRRLATARALEMLRRRVRERGRIEPMDPDGVAGRAEASDAAELADALRVALTRIEPKQAEAFCLVALDGLSHREAARELGLTENHVGVLVSRARGKLRRLLSPFDPSPDTRAAREAR
jgi:RNA polymerase sigma-70 factor (ECF subfamily)